MKLLLLFAFIVLATSRVMVEERSTAPLGWMAKEIANPNSILEMHVAVKQQNTDFLEKNLFDLADPKSARYGKWMTVKEVHDLVAPTEESIKIVNQWLEESGIDLKTVKRSPNSDLISFQTTVEIASTLVGSDYAVWENVDTSLTMLRLSSSSYSVPEVVREHIDLVAPTIQFPNIQTFKKLDVQPDVTVTPKFLKNLYGTTGYSATNASTQVAVAGLIGQYFEETDLAKFFQDFDPSSVGRKPNVVGFDGTKPGVEANLDIEYVMAMAAAVNSTFWSIAANSSDPFITLAQQLYAHDNPPSVMSISYGANEDASQTAYYSRLNAEFQKVGSIGITMLVASGDGGVAGGQPSLCFKHFIPTFPGGSPFITSVGGTQGSPEVGASLSSGGFSNVFSPPDYQKSHVAHYFSVAQGLPSSSHYNKSGNGFPDVAAEAQGFVIVSGGRTQSVAGTSCAAPTFGGVIALVNDARLNAGKSVMGFMNPFIYANPGVFNDVTTGHNPGCFTEGFPAAQGWDPVTGMGSPNFKNLVKAALSLP